MKRELYLSTFWLLLLAMLSGCSERETAEDDPEVFCEVGINVKWDGVAKIPEGMEALFYPQDTGGKPTTTFLQAKGGKINLRPGNYKVVLFNYDTEAVQIRGVDKLETLEAYTGPYTGSLGNDTKKMVWEPDPLYVTQTDISISETDKEKALEVKPRLIPQTCSFEIKVEGLEYVTSITGSISGMAASYFMGRGCCSTDSCTIYFEMQKGNDVLKGKFNYFGVPSTVLRAISVAQLITIKIVKRDGSVQQTRIDVTEAIQKASQGGEDPGGNPGINPGDGTGGNIEIEIKDEIEIPYVPPPPSGGGGIGGEVGSWDDETNIVIPMT